MDHQDQQFRPPPRPVADPDDTPEQQVKTRRAPARPRASKALPTDRLKFDQQVNALKAIAVASNYGNAAVGADDIAPRLGIIPATAGLNNTFFMESGLIVREKKGLYKPTPAVNDFARKHSFDPGAAGRALAETLKKTWYFQAVRQQLNMGPTTTDRMIRVLADVAGASADHTPKLEMLLDWLVYVGVVSTEGGQVRLIDSAPPDPTPEDEIPEEAEDKPPADGAGKGTTGSSAPQGPPADAVLSFSFDFALTADDLKGLTPEQIQAVFKAVGEVMAVKATTST